MNSEIESGLTLLPSHPFRIFKDFLEKNPKVGLEIETAFNAVLSRIDPADRGNRFVTGGAFEWILAAACGVAGIATMPGGHSENDYDLLSLRDNMRGMWSVKSATSKTLTPFRLTNTMNSKGTNFAAPTVFLHPKFPGIVYVNPLEAPKLASKVKVLKDATTLSSSLLLQFAKQNPQLVIPLSTPFNPKTGKGDPYLDFVAGILTAGTYPNLGPIISELKDNARTINLLRSQFERGILTKDQYQIELDKLYGKN
jgi:hypothetical protein